jgi:hypothetical protein
MSTRKGSGTGMVVNEWGYLRYTRRGPLRNRLVHRAVMAEMCREFCYYPLNGNGLPAGMEVHHQDFDRRHNCRANLVLLDPALHFHADSFPRGQQYRDQRSGRFLPRPEMPPGAVVTVWVEFPCTGCGRVKRIPAAWADPRAGSGTGGCDDAPDWVTARCELIDEGREGEEANRYE